MTPKLLILFSLAVFSIVSGSAASSRNWQQEAFEDRPPCILANGKEARPPKMRGLYFDRELFRSADIASAHSSFDQFSNEPVVLIAFTKLAGQRLTRLTKRKVGFAMPIFLDSKLLSCPIVNEPITGGQLQLSGGFSAAEAAKLAAKLRAS